MTIHKVLIVRTKLVPTTSFGGHSYSEEHRAYSEYQYFSTLEKAKAFCQQYIDQPIQWQNVGGDCLTSECQDVDFNIYVEDGSEFDTLTKPSLPDNFAPRRYSGD